MIKKLLIGLSLVLFYGCAYSSDIISLEGGVNSPAFFGSETAYGYQTQISYKKELSDNFFVELSAYFGDFRTYESIAYTTDYSGSLFHRYITVDWYQAGFSPMTGYDLIRNENFCFGLVAGSAITFLNNINIEEKIFQDYTMIEKYNYKEALRTFTFQPICYGMNLQFNCDWGILILKSKWLLLMPGIDFVSKTGQYNRILYTASSILVGYGYSFK